MNPAIALLEFSSIATGIAAGDAMVKAAPVDALRAGSVQPGKYLVLVRGDTASVEEAIKAGVDIGAGTLIDHVFLPDVHPAVMPALAGVRLEPVGEALGIIETTTVASLLNATDGAIKSAVVVLNGVAAADGLGGKAYSLIAGTVADVEAAIDTARNRMEDTASLVGARVIAQLHAEMAANVWHELRFAPAIASLGI